MAFLDQQVSNQATEIAARTLGLPMLEGSHVSGLAEIPDLPGPLDSAMVAYDTASFDLDNLAHFFLIPPLANIQAQPHSCDPHGRRGFIPASLEQLMNFLREGGQIVNFCDGRCDADFGAVRALSTGDDLRFEIPFNDTAPCQS